jgi:uncharacterized protein (TIGR02145 family)
MKENSKLIICISLLLGIIMTLDSCKKKEDMDTIVETLVKDNEGNTYKAVTIGTQVWMAENLKVTKYRNGDPIGTTALLYNNIENEVSPKYQWINVDGAHSDEAGNLATYGRLYTWYVVEDSRKICPLGWHIPSHAEWIKLTDYVGGEEIAGGLLKETGFTHWNSPNTSATDKYGFKAVGGGERFSSGTGNLKMFCSFWSDTEYELNPATRAWSVSIFSDFASLSFPMSFKYYGSSVRCVKD